VLGGSEVGEGGRLTVEVVPLAGAEVLGVGGVMSTIKTAMVVRHSKEVEL
jgi:hypothetical protein